MGRDRPAIYPGRATMAILEGTEDLSLWTEEELLRGQRKAKNGRWVGPRPKVVPTAVHQELVQRRMLNAHTLLGENLVKAVQVLVDIATDKRADAAVRVKAANTIIERVLGKVPERVHLAPDEKPAFMKAIEAGIVEMIGIVPSQTHALPAGEEEDDSEGLHDATGRRRRGA